MNWRGLRKGDSGPGSDRVLGSHSWSLDDNGNGWFKGDILIEGDLYHKRLDKIEAELDDLAKIVRWFAKHSREIAIPEGAMMLWSDMKNIPAGWTRVWGLPFLLRKN